MIAAEELEKVKTLVKEFLEKITAGSFSLNLYSLESVPTDTISVEIVLEEPQLFIGQNGQTLVEMERLLRMMFCKKLQKNLYVSLDINEYKKKKIEHLKKLANDIAREAVTANEKKILPPMSSYDRRIIHDELAKNTEVLTESEGEGMDRRVVIKPR